MFYPHRQVLHDAYPLVILSNADTGFLEVSVPKLGADFHAVYTTEQAGLYKPRHGAFDYMLDQLGANPEDVPARLLSRGTT